MAILQKVHLGLRVEWMGERDFADSWGWDANSRYERLKLYVWMVISLFSAGLKYTLEYLYEVMDLSVIVMNR